MEWFKKNIAANHVAQLSDLLEEGLFFIDAEARILKTNAAFRKKLGYDEADVDGISMLDIFAHKESLAGGSPEKQNNILSFKFYYFDLAARQPLPLTLLDKAGGKVPVLLRAVIFDHHDRRNLYGLGIASWEKSSAENDGQNDAAREAGRLWELEQNYRNVLKSSGDAIVITDFNGWIVDVNDAFLAMVGYDRPAEVEGKYLLEFVPMVEGDFPCSTGEIITITKPWQDRHVASIDTLFETGMVKFESYVVHRDGTHVTIDATMSMLKDQKGERRGTVAIFKDITERIKTQQEVLRSKVFLENVFDTTGDGIYVTDSLGHIIKTNSAFRAFTGYTEEELTGKYAVELLPDGSHDDVSQEGFDRMFGNGYFSQYEDVWQKKDGTLYPVEAKLAVLFNSRGEYDGLVGSLRDISERKQAEKALLGAKLFLENVFATASDGIYVTDEKGHYRLVNQAFCNMTGYARDELIGQDASMVLAALRGGPDVAALEGADADASLSRFQTTWQRKDGTVFSVESRIAMLETPGGEYAGNVGTVRDITGRKRMEEELRRSHEDLERKVRERTESLAEINAALRVLLNKRDEDKKALEDSMLQNVNGLIMPYLEKLKACRLDERQKIYVDIMEKNFNDLIAPFLRSECNLRFTPMEIQVANLVRQGKSTKEISAILSICEKTVSFHRDKIRNKIGLKKSKVSLRSHFASGKHKNA
ncbi:MAG: PAS domain S-box protein [Deltaproteobacteria bacterium]|nr:PAS domain S-box protein [Deltaproteobacteria bacterium]